MLKTSKKTRGFTLVELMVTLAVLAIIIGIAVPNMGTFIKKQAVRSTADEMVLSMVYARSEALKTNKNTFVLPVAGGWANGWCITTSTNCTKEAGLLRLFTPSRKNLEFKDFGAQFGFTGKGMRSLSSSIGGTIKNDVEQRCIEVSFSGHTKVTDC